MVVKVAFPVSVPGFYDYLIPLQFEKAIFPGSPVKVNLRNRNIWGVAVEINEKSNYPNLKEVLEIKEGKWNTSGVTLMQLYKWISNYYITDLGKVFKPLIQKKIADLSSKKVTQFLVVDKDYESLTAKQRESYLRIKEVSEPLSSNLLISRFNLSTHMINMLVKKGFLEKHSIEVMREAEVLQERLSQGKIKLTAEQTNAVDEIWNDFRKPTSPFLIHGITGSGKTHVYIELAKRVLKEGKGVILLVPEISLTPQTIRRFSDAIGEDIAVIHSRMSNGERRDSVEQIVSGKRRVVIGVRSAILVPMVDPGIIIVDEEHDGSYKQSDPEPRYNARDVAVVRGAFQSALVVLGSATPSFESYYNSKSGKYKLITLLNRFGNAKLPDVKIFDMNKEHKEKNFTILSRYLKNRIEEVLQEGNQIILLINRRGFSVSLVCRDCGHPYSCPHCSVNLIYHRNEQCVKCHQCGYTEPLPEACPECGGEQIKYQGTGIQKVEEYLTSLYPNVNILRMDQDTTRRKGAHVKIIDKFAKREADILLGTQMVAKGLDFPDVSLVGVLQADTGLHFPDFRASERTFQLLTQVAGRAGRGDKSGEVIVQTYSPDEKGIIFSRTHDYLNFFDSEILAREKLNYPPFGRLARILALCEDEDLVRNFMFTITKKLKDAIEDNDVTILGPAPAVLEKLRNLYRYTILIKAENPTKLNKLLWRLNEFIVKSKVKIRIKIDVDPVNML